MNRFIRAAICIAVVTLVSGCRGPWWQPPGLLETPPLRNPGASRSNSEYDADSEEGSSQSKRPKSSIFFDERSYSIERNLGIE